ncbi:aldo/keto reductase [Sphingobacterium sp. FBM7-1]|uniref:aldo/keto reductase n=1 Tax=Sphingobacterium sp. FBM7-1 TaxID=2886688 RepID=UPI001D0FD387|nr:aldo/keto reductase [Sphingobacterium sp. FBM7-1]MCC2598017.1 aldo/keto reductase [Sphingobacterium sp. FBM7-1]
MMQRRTFLKHTGLATAGMAASALLPVFATDLGINSKNKTMEQVQNSGYHKRFRPNSKVGFGGVALGNGFDVNPDVECLQSMEAAWDAGVRYFDTSPWYGLGISERRMGLFLKDQQREDYVISTKIGRILHPHDDFKLEENWKGQLNFSYEYDYTAEGVRRSVEASLQRLGIGSLDIVFIHDLSPDNGDMKDDWLTYFEIAARGAMPELTKMREEGLIKGWGLGVNTIEPILKTIEVADPDIFLSACQYSLIHHRDDLNQVFPKAAERDISIVVGAPLCAGFLAGKDRYLYGGDFPAGVKEKLAALQRVSDNHRVDLRTAALQFAAAPEVVSAVIPGAHTVEQAQENAASFEEKIPAAFWEELKQERLIEENAPVPK